jgi:hypothetical protein
MIVPQATPNARATAATDSPSRPTRRAAVARARSVSDARICGGLDGLLELAAAARSPQRTPDARSGRPAEGSSGLRLKIVSSTAHHAS